MRTILLLVAAALVACGTETGPAGKDGVPGSDGAPGAPGAPGDDGDPGEPGTDGDPGEAGSVGPGGPAGPQGEQGAQGVAGPPGPAGPGVAFVDATNAPVSISCDSEDCVVFDSQGNAWGAQTTTGLPVAVSEGTILYSTASCQNGTEVAFEFNGPVFAATAYNVGGLTVRALNPTATEIASVNFSGFRGPSGTCVASSGTATAAQTTFLVAPSSTTVLANPGQLFVPPLRRIPAP